MKQCTECGTFIHLNNEQDDRIECHTCGIELEMVDKSLVGLQLGPSEE
jgi:lysine biosynthesis protein LysW